MRDIQSSALPAAVTNAIRHLALRAGGRFTQFGHSRQDVEQELILHYLRHRHQHDSERASAATFAAHICRNRAFGMLAAALAEKRGAGATVGSLSAPVAIGQSDKTIERGATISEDAYHMKTGRRSRPAAELMLLRIDVDQVVSGLPTDLADLAHLLAAGESLVGVAHQLEISRATVHRRVLRLRRIFRGAGLDTYINMQEAA
jgi:DNA-directed RNA polymerase specialized sigma24 family protein